LPGVFLFVGFLLFLNSAPVLLLENGVFKQL